MGIADGRLKGKDSIPPYWSQGLAVRPRLRFELIDVLAGVNSVAIYYRNITRLKRVIETVEFNAQRLGIRAEAIYRAE